MEKFIKLESIAAALPLINVDTDMIIPKQFLKTIKRTGLGKHLFHEMRFDEDGNKIEDFVLHQAPFDKANILVSGDNFGCGSSREHAPWAITDFGIKCIIAPSFADIFYNNCFKNGVLPVTLDKKIVDELTKDAKNKHTFIVDLQTCQITVNSKIFDFEVDPFRKECLINGLDDIGLSLQKEELINQFEEQNSQKLPWLYN